jgi:tetrapyrrole methylase family protein/MazG family protein
LSETVAGRVVVVGLGPAGHELLSAQTLQQLKEHPHLILRTKVHPAAGIFAEAASFDERYEQAESFDELYAGIVDELAAMAERYGEVLYAVPGSPLVAEHTVELLRKRDDLEVVIIPAMSFLDLCWVALGIDPVAKQVQLLDAHQLSDALDYGGPLLIAQTHSRAVLSEIKLSVDTDIAQDLSVVILHHLGLADQQVLTVAFDELDHFEAADHLTSIYVEGLRSVEDASRDLVAMMRRLRAECPWDQKQTHGSLARHLLEEAYESLEAIEELSRCLDQDDDEHLSAAYAHAQEELGDVVFQVVFHAHLAAEEGRFDLAGVFDGVREKLIRRHPHVFGDAVADTADDVARRWEEIKREEKGRTSVTEGIPAALPSLARYVKLRRKAVAIGMEPRERNATLIELRRALDQLSESSQTADDATASQTSAAASEIGDLLSGVAELAHQLGVDPEETLRHRASLLAEVIKDFEAQH